MPKKRKVRSKRLKRLERLARTAAVLRLRGKIDRAMSYENEIERIENQIGRSSNPGETEGTAFAAVNRGQEAGRKIYQKLGR